MYSVKFLTITIKLRRWSVSVLPFFSNWSLYSRNFKAVYMCVSCETGLNLGTMLFFVLELNWNDVIWCTHLKTLTCSTALDYCFVWVNHFQQFQVKKLLRASFTLFPRVISQFQTSLMKSSPLVCILTLLQGNVAIIESSKGVKN